ncbi:NAD-dependent epimerase/dehydratase family protein [Gloeocapsopsis crepidinum LEGE 06123]|uniref:NAD-dependent epimerase/dehydratase family protein n=1 Tax=Gloeocapsopsis crepidinum LEGE 06123 TaxID=588587 RepID=A0ABR9UZH6_9CHRO|nr:NAD-dependent epimerase/dehydratase family protein [Gloeocapsopsis crepidinum]MBE9193729.1 NAD-dependent epimerase/dehydratase family protein [Gloeocapsopsis crepidinum LEGE 06123]
MNVFLTGATGYIGSVVAEKLQAAGHTIVGLARNEATAEKLAKRDIKPFIGDLQNPEPLIDAARQTDGVIHTAFIHNFDDWAGAVQTDCRVIAAFTCALAGAGKPLIATSDTSVLGDTGADIADEGDAIASNFFLAERAKAEAAVIHASKQNIRSVVLRLPLYIYGRGGGTSYIPMRVQAAQESGVAYYIAPGEHQVSAVDVDDVAQLYVLALEKAPAGSIYHAATQSGISEKAIAQAISDIVSCKIEGISLEQATQQWGRGIAAFFSINNQTTANKAIQLGWQPQAALSLLEDIAHYQL